MKIKNITSALLLAGVAATAQAEVCKKTPGSMTCGKGTVHELIGNGMVAVNGTTVEGATMINGMLTAEDANFSALNVNGSVSLMQCTINDTAEIKGSLNASSTKFERSLQVYSNAIRLINSKINSNLQMHHSDNHQEIYLDNNSEVGGDIVFADGAGKVYVRGGSKIVGKVIGGEIITQ